MNPWLPSLPSVPGGTRVLCLPPSGTGAAFYASLRRTPAPEGLDLLPVQLPGRESRLNEPLLTNLRTLAHRAADELGEEFSDGHTMLFGHSMGGALAFELAVELDRRGGPRPSAVVVSACTPPHAEFLGLPMQDAPDAEFIEMLRRMGGTPAALLANKEFMAMTVPILRADLTMCETHRPRGDESLTVPLLTVGGSLDEEVSVDWLAGWKRYARAGFAGVVAPGGHHYLLEPAGARSVANLLLRARDLSAENTPTTPR
ncbi:MAG TPA: alpha/beta fold hydrolase [Candidatus Nocardiopsis merdipullorum]|nr:alpha/beta fold hydrolase [Candidatus Nocardiopsis merdipullorum]